MVLGAIELLLKLQDQHKMTQSAAKDMFDVVASLLPEGNNMCTYDEAVSCVTKHQLTGAVKVDACVNDHCLFENAPLKYDPLGVRQLADARECPKCGEDRFHGSGRPRKVVRFFPLSATLRRLFSSSESIALLRPADDRDPISALHNTRGWREQVWEDPTGFSNDTRNQVVSLCTDGVNPFGGKSSNYSLWPMMFRRENEPGATRNDYRKLLLWGLVPGQYTSSGNGRPVVTRRMPTTLVPYLNRLADELLECYEPEGVAVEDWSEPVGSRRRNFGCRVKLLLVVCDWPGHGFVAGQKYAGYGGCMGCTSAGWPWKGSTIVHGGYRHLLPDDHPFLVDPRFGDALRHRHPPVERTHEAVMARARVVQRAKDRDDPNYNKLRKRLHVNNICPLTRLSYFNIVTAMPPDLMHMVKNIMTNFFGLMKDVRGVRLRKGEVMPKDDENLEEKDMAIDSQVAPQAPIARNVRSRRHQIERTRTWNISKDMQAKIDRLFTKLPSPPGCLLRSLRPFRNTGRMNMHAWVQFVETYGAYIMAGMFSPENADVFQRLVKVHFLAFRTYSIGRIVYSTSTTLPITFVSTCVASPCFADGCLLFFSY
jgi:hypothetical protein